jgi:ubiquinone/menaquinone biosynthesis C-methylase UbiE/uncharacterized protein YbaR (Trm112 family)
MNKQLVDLLICPTCKVKPELTAFQEQTRSTSQPQEDGAVGRVLAGTLRCGKCDVIYPVIDGVPRFLDDGIKRFPDFVTKYRPELQPSVQHAEVVQAGPERDGENDYENIRKSFSQEWSIFDYDADKTWGWTLDERKKVFLEDIQMKPEELRGKTMLDAGCGNGTMTAALSGFGLEIVGLDLNDGLGRAYANRGKYAPEAVRQVQYVQGNLVKPPLKESVFDLIYSSGVIHHTPSSKKTFESLVRLVEKGGRLYVWVYGKRPWPVRLFFWWGRGLKHWMTLKSVMRICRLLSPLYKMGAELLHAIGLMSFRRRNTQEITLDLFDAFAPRYNHWHTEAEVRSWFEDQGFRNVHVSGIQKHGFGMYGDKS